MSSTPPLAPNHEHRPIDRLLWPVQRFLRVEASAGILLLLATAAALVWANGPAGEGYDHFWHTPVSVGWGTHVLTMSLAHFVNDGLMAIFFFVVGLEIKRELLVGELASFRQASVPIAAAVGGMVAPALIYVAFNAGGEGTRGWAIPTATDIAFAVGVLAMLGRRVPLSLKVFLTALAIVDDIGAVLVIAIFYTSDLSLTALGAAGGFIVLSYAANRAGVRTPIFYACVGILLWLMLLQSGVHATIAGVLLALTIPVRMRIRGTEFVSVARRAIETFEEAGGNVDDTFTSPQRQRAVRGLEEACEGVLTPLNRLEHELHPWVAFLIMPIFALANAGVTIGGGTGSAAASPIALGVALGLILGKPIGVMVAAWIAVKIGLGELPRGSSWRQVLGASCLAGIGFTMSLFIANLAFREGDALLPLAKVGILGGSLISGVVGAAILLTAARPKPPVDDPGGPA
ncbi:MAG: Na+/H+ antiporter NhaA [Phycisphaerales bacterium]|nr:Na+/H+ antiporter NhaA [Phycisphaerae bacterium]NNF44556.1 Na+/H+ antiporter NhaA [Phycisphaerales bacterium]NNM26540.1 Na+/H+ antiporter NhaA [Phycisphaerales bacterium]